jgi:hypothetical protein
MKNSSRSSVKSLVVSLMVLAFTFVIGVRPSQAQSVPFTQHTSVPLAGAVSNPCNNDTVLITGGTQHVVIHSFLNQSNGLFQVIIVTNPEDASATSATTSTNYRIVGITIDSFTSSAPQEQFTVTISDDLIAEGPAPSFHLRFLLHLTINALGIPTATVDNFSTSCMG